MSIPISQIVREQMNTAFDLLADIQEPAELFEERGSDHQEYDVKLQRMVCVPGTKGQSPTITINAIFNTRTSQYGLLPQGGGGGLQPAEVERVELIMLINVSEVLEKFPDRFGDGDEESKRVEFIKSVAIGNTVRRVKTDRIYEITFVEYDPTESVMSITLSRSG